MVTEVQEVAVVEHPPLMAGIPEPHTILMRPGNFQSYMGKLWKMAHEEIDKATLLIAQKQRELDEIRERVTRLIEHASAIEDDGQQVSLNRTQLRSAQVRLTRAITNHKRAIAFRNALDSGYVPLPRMPAVNLRWVEEIMPHDVLDAMEEAKQAGIFEEFRLVTGEQANSNGWPSGKRFPGRDPLRRVPSGNR